VTATVFLSRPAALSEGQEQLFLSWSKCLSDLGFLLERLQRQQYTEVPWHQLRHIIEGVDGVVTFGFAQSIQRAVRGRAEVATAGCTSPWTHIEAAMAVEARIPTLVIPEPGILDGVFDPSVWSGGLYGVRPGAAPSRDAVPEPWIAAVRLASRRADEPGRD
jgi:hypothetical protein